MSWIGHCDDRRRLDVEMRSVVAGGDEQNVAVDRKAGP